MKIAYQGIPGSYSESCAKTMYSDCETISCKTFDECFDKASKDSNVRCIIPESNKTTGNIGVEYLIFKYRLNIYAEHFFPINHNLLGINGSNLDDISDVYSHAHAKRFLCLMVYLNDDFEDGETYFPLFDVGVKPKQGRLFIFPPTWNYIHRGNPPRSPSKRGAKYFVMTHLNYMDLSVVNEGTDFSDRKVAAYDPNTKKMTKEQLLWPKA